MEEDKCPFCDSNNVEVTEERGSDRTKTCNDCLESWEEVDG